MKSRMRYALESCALLSMSIKTWVSGTSHDANHSETKSGCWTIPYGELEADLRAQVEAELESSPTPRQNLRATVAALRSQSCLPQQATESTQRMTLVDAAGSATRRSQADGTPALAGGGQAPGVPDRLRSVAFTNPATGIFGPRLPR